MGGSGGFKETGVMKLFKSNSLLNKGGEAVSTYVALKDRVVVLYFATNIDICWDFNVFLKKFYQTIIDEGDNSMAVVFVSGDNKPELQTDFFNDDTVHDDWLCMSMSDLESIYESFGIEKVPYLVVLDMDGNPAKHGAQEEMLEIFNSVLSDQAKDHGWLEDLECPTKAVVAKWKEWKSLARHWKASVGYTLNGSEAEAAISRQNPRPHKIWLCDLCMAKNNRDTRRCMKCGANHCLAAETPAEEDQKLDLHELRARRVAKFINTPSVPYVQPPDGKVIGLASKQGTESSCGISTYDTPSPDQSFWSKEPRGIAERRARAIAMQSSGCEDKKSTSFDLEEAIEDLIYLGFEHARAEDTLRASKGDVNAAVFQLVGENNMF